MFDFKSEKHLRNLERATGIALTVLDANVRNSTLLLISLYYAAVSKGDKGREMATLITDNETQK